VHRRIGRWRRIWSPAPRLSLVPASVPPRHRAAVGPRRTLAVAVAAVVTALSVGGALGLGPGAAVGEPDRNGSAQGSRDAAAVAAALEEAPSADATETDGGDGDEGWMITDEGEPAEVATPSDSKSTPEPDRAKHDKSGQRKSAKHEPAALPSSSGHGRRIVFDISAQRVWLVAGNDHVARTYRVSGSRYPDTLSPATYKVYSMSPHAVSYDSLETMRYMVRFTHGERAAIGFHDIPVSQATGKLVQTRAQLGQKLSAGCIRQWIRDAKALWRFSHIGTKVVVTA